MWPFTRKPKPPVTSEALDHALRRAMMIEQARGDDEMVGMLRQLKDLNEAFTYLGRGAEVPAALQAKIDAAKQTSDEA